MKTSYSTAMLESPLLDFGPFGRRPKGWEGRGEASSLLLRALLLLGSALTLIA